ncbi:hypothetical protein FQN57_004139 [Myotisia sp. PD_48]|nr:hypothetical protein FQN57_004139 [Myotisia sp. PD_48]
MTYAMNWQEKAAAKKADSLSKIPQEWRLSTEQLQNAKLQKQFAGDFIQSFLSDAERTICSLESTSIVEKIKTGEYTSSQVTAAYCKAAAIAHQINPCLLEIFFDQGLERAKYLDEYLLQNGKPMGPLHGLPVSLKDQFHVKGHDTTMGYVGWIGTYEGSKDPEKVHKVDSQLVTELLSLGAVLYCKTSVPQTLLIGETENNIIGRTLNPWNTSLTCGGSSGGEGALLALGGSSVGVGTDIGGSVRIPAAFCGIYSIKPSHNRISYKDMANTNPGQTIRASSVGFMSTSPDALKLMLESVLSTEPWLRDPDVIYIPWRDQIVSTILARVTQSGSVKDGQQPLKFGILWKDDLATPHPPITRGLQIITEAIKKAGHKVVEWKPPAHKPAMKLLVGGMILAILLGLLQADGATDVHKQLALSGEPLLPALMNFLSYREPTSLLEYQNMVLESRDYCTAYAEYWNSTNQDDGEYSNLLPSPLLFLFMFLGFMLIRLSVAGQLVDVIIMPAAPSAAVVPGQYHHTGYTQIMNMLDYSAAVLPVTKADKSIDKADASFKALSDVDQKIWDDYDAELFHNAPVGVQLVGRKHEEEKVWAITKIVDSILKST